MQLSMKNTSIGIRIALALALPIAALLFLSLWTLANYHRAANETHDLRKMAEFAPAVSALIHELQQERGLSAGFLGSGGTDFAERLANRHEKTDVQRAVFFGALKRVGIEHFDPRQGHSLAAVQQNLDRLPAWRSAVAGQKLTAEEAIENYSKTIDQLIATLKILLLLSTSSELSTSINA